MNEQLIKAIFAAGFRLGHKSGADEATSYERGYAATEPQTSDEAWNNDIQWMLDSKNVGFDLANETHWNQV